jgi:hypothetical protein
MRCGLPAVNLSDSLSEISQMAAFISHQNHKLSHTIDSDWRCFSEFASLACTNSLLGALGEYELQKKKLAVTSVFFKEPRSHNAFVGHRRWLMHPCLESIGYGSTKDYEAITPQLRVPCLRDTVYQYSYPPHGQINAQLVSEKWSWSVYPYEAIDSDSMRIEVRCQKRNIPIKILSKEKFLGDFTIVFQLKQLLKDNEISNEFLNKEIEVVISNYKINGIIEKSSYSVFINKNSDKED